MKKLVIAFILCIEAFSLSAQKLEKVHSIVVVRHEKSWYETQMKLWNAEVEKNRKNPDAWYNYYSAARALRNLEHDNPEKQKEYGKICTEIAKGAYAEIPETFEGNHIMVWNGGLDDTDSKYLKKAYEINPDDPRIYDDILILGELTRDQKMFHDMAVRIFEKNEMPGAMINWAYNLLSELEQDAIIFVAGDNDTYSMWIAQEALGYRQDVHVINTSLILLDDYRSKILAEIGLSSFEMDETPEKQDELYKHILNNTAGIPAYVSVSAIRQFNDKPIMDELFLTGLAYKYCESSLDNMSLIRRNYEKRFLTDHLQMSFSPHVADERAVQFKSLYLPMLIKLYKHYKVSEEKEKETTLLALIQKIGQETGKEDDIKKQLNE